MRVKASFFGSIHRPWPEQSRELDLPEGTDVRTLLASLGYQPEDMRRVAAVIDGRKKLLDTELHDNDHVRFVLLAGGG